MNEGYSTALMLMAVGMVTVFTILALIVLFGNLLISLVNKYVPEAETLAKTRQDNTSKIDPKTMAAIVAAIDMATQGKTKVTSVARSK